MKTNPQARIGMVNFINTAPLYDVWQRTVQQPRWQVVEAPPSVLNRMLFHGELDLGFVSSHEYAVHPAHYRILADLSISASGKVGSVFLFSNSTPAELDGRLVLLSSQSQTSVSLVKIILEEFVGIAPRYEIGEVFGNRDGRERPDAVLAIGDEALRLAHSREYAVQLDLGEVWQAHTGLPFVFAVWAVRERFCRQEADSVRAIHRELLRCIDQGRQQLENISRRVASRIPMDPAACYAYLQGLEYDLGAEKQQALRLFIDYLVKRGEAGDKALPLRICAPA